MDPQDVRDSGLNVANVNGQSRTSWAVVLQGRWASVGGNCYPKPHSVCNAPVVRGSKWKLRAHVELRARMVADGRGAVRHERPGSGRSGIIRQTLFEEQCTILLIVIIMILIGPICEIVPIA